MHRLFRDKWGPFILRSDVKAISGALFVVYLIVSFYGCIRMKVDISPHKYIRDTSPIQTFVYLAGINLKFVTNSFIYLTLRQIHLG